MTRRQGDAVVALRGEHLDILGRHRIPGLAICRLPGCRDDLVGEQALRGDHVDLVAGHQLVDAVERRPVGGAVSGDAGVARLPGQGSSRVVARPLLQVGLADALDDDVLHTDAGDPDDADGFALRRRSHRRRSRRVSLGELLAQVCQLDRRIVGRAGGVAQFCRELVGQLRLLAGRLQARAPQLERDEAEDQQARDDEELADRPEDLSEHSFTVSAHGGEQGAAGTVRTRGAHRSPPSGRRADRPLSCAGRRRPGCRPRRDRAPARAERSRQDHLAAGVRRPGDGQLG